MNLKDTGVRVWAGLNWLRIGFSSGLLWTRFYLWGCINFSIQLLYGHAILLRSRLCVMKVRFQVLTAAGMKVIAFWDVAPCSLVEVYQRFRGACWLYRQGYDWGSKHLWNVGKLLPDYTAQHPRWQSSYVCHEVRHFWRSFHCWITYGDRTAKILVTEITNWSLMEACCVSFEVRTAFLVLFKWTSFRETDAGINLWKRPLLIPINYL
jgi:hypothetical protein